MACRLPAPSHYLNQCWNIVNWTPRNKLCWNFNWNSYIFIQENPFENVVWKMTAILSRSQCVNPKSRKGFIKICLNVLPTDCLPTHQCRGLAWSWIAHSVCKCASGLLGTGFLWRLSSNPGTSPCPCTFHIKICISSEPKVTLFRQWQQMDQKACSSLGRAVQFKFCSLFYVDPG